MATEGLAPAFLGALQASVAVLLTIGYGVIASQYGILRDSSAKDISKLCVKMCVCAKLQAPIALGRSWLAGPFACPCSDEKCGIVLTVGLASCIGSCRRC